MNKPKIVFFLLSLFCAFPKYSNASLALILGVSYTLLFNNPYAAKTSSWGGILLKAAVIGLGFGINISVLYDAGKENIGNVSFFIFLVLGLGYIFTKALKLDRKIGVLISTGTAICGGSAIAAVGSVLKADSNQLSVSTGIVFLLNAIALLVFPLIGHSLGLSQVQFGTWAAIAIHDMSSVVGASHSFGNQALKIATITKMLRVVWIIPISLTLVFGFRQNRETFKIPMFIIGFLIASLIRSYLPNYQNTYDLLYAVSKQIMVLSLFFIGCSISLSNIKKVGKKVVILAVSLWLIVSVLSLMYVMYFKTSL